MSLRAWIQAARPLAQLNIAPPLLFGQALAFAVCGTFSWKRLLWVQLFGVLDQLFIVFANDAADWKSDRQNTTFNAFSGGSRVVPEGKLTPLALAKASLVMALGMGLVGAYLGFVKQLPFMLLLVCAAVLLLWLYSFPPLRLGYRGHGEILQGLGLGVVLPVIGFYAQCGALSPLPWRALLPAFLLGWAGNLVTSLPDQPSDAATHKRSYAVRRGARAARRDALIAIAIAALGAPLVLPGASTLGLAVVTALPLALVVANLRDLARADADNRAACQRFVTLAGAAIAATLLGWSVVLVVG